MEISDDQYFEMNRKGWDQRANIHFESRLYDVEGFVSGGTSLKEIELTELVNVTDKRLLHLQCHFGMDTLSWVRKGAVCTGVDISPVAIEKARELSFRTKLDAAFVCSDIYGFKRLTSVPFDIVFTSYGAICWLPDLNKWADVIASNLKVGGTFYIVEFHPIYDLIAGYSYFTQLLPDVEETGTYTENGADAVAKLAVWVHPLSNVINALIGVGFQIERVNEFPFSPYPCFEGMVEREPGRFYLSHKGNDVPIVFSLTARKVAE